MAERTAEITGDIFLKIPWINQEQFVTNLNDTDEQSVIDEGRCFTREGGREIITVVLGGIKNEVLCVDCPLYENCQVPPAFTHPEQF